MQHFKRRGRDNAAQMDNNEKWLGARVMHPSGDCPHVAESVDAGDLKSRPLALAGLTHETDETDHSMIDSATIAASRG
jgi:hypothetical protein